MKIAAVAKPPSDTNLRTLAQIGVEHQCFYGLSSDPDEYTAAKEKAERNGLRLSVVEHGPAMDLIVMGAQGTGGVELMMSGSNTQHVVRAASCPVLTVRA